MEQPDSYSVDWSPLNFGGKTINFDILNALQTITSMKIRTLYIYLFLCLCIVGLFTRSHAQTITTGSSSISSICTGTGGTGTVSFTTSGTFASTNIFSAELSDAAGTFPTNPPVIGSSKTSPIPITFSSALPAGSGYKIRVVSSNRVIISTNSSAFTVDRRPGKPAVTTPQQACLGDAPKPLVAPLFSDDGVSLKWYTVSPGGTSLPATPQPPTGSAVTTPYYVSQVSAKGCESADRSPIEFKVFGIPGAPSVSSSLTYCQGVSTDLLTAIVTPSGGASLLWWGRNQQGGLPESAPKPDNQNSATYYVSQTKDNCESKPRTPIAVTIVPTPAKPQVADLTAVCSGSPVGSLSATAAQGNTLRWWGESQQNGSFTPTPPPVSNTRSATYYVSQATAKEGCDGPRESIFVRIKKIPGAPTAPDPGPFCQSKESRKLIATTTEPTATLSWYDSGDQLLPGGAPTPPTSTTGVFIYYVRQTLEECLSTGRKTIQGTVNAIPNAPTVTPQRDLCEGTGPQPLSASGTELKWYDDNQNGGTPSSSASIVKTTGSYVGKTTNYYVSQTVSNCESGRAFIPVRVKDTPNAPGVPAAGAFDFCRNSAAIPLTATHVDKATANWFDSDGRSLGQSVTPPNNVETTYTYTVSQTLEECTGPTNSVRVRVKPLPTQPGVGPVGLCNNQRPEQLRASGDRLKWYDNSENFISTNAPSPAKNNVGDQFYKVSQTSGDNCEGPKATLKVTIKPLPGQPGVANVNYCQTQADQPAQNVSALTAGGQNLRWYNPDGNPFNTTPTPGIDRAGVQTYQVSQTVDNCEGGRATLTVTVNTVPAPAVAKPLIAYCINEKATPLEAAIEPGARVQWRDPYDRLTTEAPTPSTLNTNVDLAGDRFFVYQIGQNGCYSPRSTIRVIVNTTPTLSLAAPVPVVNLGLRVPLRLTFTGSAPYSYTISGGYSGTSRTNDTTIAVLPRGNTTYQVAAVTNGCGTGLPGNPATAVVMVRVPTVATGSLASSTLCVGTSLTVPFTTTGQFNTGNTFQFELVSSTDTSKKYDIPATAIASPITATLPLTIPSGQYTVRVKALNPEVGVTGTNSPTLLTVRSLPVATLTGTQAVYEGAPASLTITFVGDGPWALTYADSVRSYSVTTAVSPYVAEVRPARTTTYRITVVTNSCGSGPASGTAIVSVLPLLGIDDNLLDPLVTVYPVPTSHLLTVELDLPLIRDPAKLSLLNMQGQSVLQHTTRSHRTELDLSTQPNGLYILRIQIGDRHTVRKVMKL